MRLPRFAPILAVIAVIAASAPARFVAATPIREVAIVNIAGPMQVRDVLLQGTYVFEHDANRMARGEPCTAIYEFTPEKGIGKCVATFHCLPRETGTTVDRFTLTAKRMPDLSSVTKLVEYQFSGSREAHGIPRH